MSRSLSKDLATFLSNWRAAHGRLSTQSTSSAVPSSGGLADHGVLAASATQYEARKSLEAVVVVLGHLHRCVDGLAARFPSCVIDLTDDLVNALGGLLDLTDDGMYRLKP
jgi:hypothetical protein